jgi:hypothetical protein
VSRHRNTMAHDPTDGNALSIEGKTVASARSGRDDLGYDYVSLLFSDGTILRVQEEGQSGWIRTEVRRLAK